MSEGSECERCLGSGILNDLAAGKEQGCPVCLGLGRYVRPAPRPENEHHLIALHSTVLDFDELVMMLPLREPKENWHE